MSITTPVLSLSFYPGCYEIAPLRTDEPRLLAQVALVLSGTTGPVCSGEETEHQSR